MTPSNIDNNQLLTLMITMNTQIGKLQGQLEAYLQQASRGEKDINAVCDRVSLLEKFQYKVYGIAVGIGMVGGVLGEKIAQVIHG